MANQLQICRPPASYDAKSTALYTHSQERFTAIRFTRRSVNDLDHSNWVPTDFGLLVSKMRHQASVVHWSNRPRCSFDSLTASFTREFCDPKSALLRKAARLFWSALSTMLNCVPPALQWPSILERLDSLLQFIFFSIHTNNQHDWTPIIGWILIKKQRFVCRIG